MMRDTLGQFVGLFLFFFVQLPLTTLYFASAAPIPAVDRSQGIKFQRPPLRFEINEGQTDPRVNFTARDRDGIAFLTSDGVVFQISRAIGTPELKPGFKKASHSPATSGFESSFVRMKTVGANPNPRIVGIDRLPGVTNYFIGNDPTQWRTNVAGYGKVKYESVYRGIDLVYYDNGEGSLEYDFIVAPGADPAQIALSIENSQSVEVQPDGDLIITAATGTIRKPAPHVYQEIDGKRREIAAGYRLIATNNRRDTRQSSLKSQQVAFALGAYDRSRPLVIDPQVLYATYLGGSSNSTITNEGARGVAADAQGSVYIVGVTQSTNFPTKNPEQGTLHGFTNAFITKLDANGQLVYSTYLGGSGFDEGTVIKVDDTGAAYIGGVTSSIDFPTPNGALSRGGRNDGFITKLNPAGSQIVFSTYIGGTDNDSVADLALDAQKNVFVVGNVAPALGVPAIDFPLVNPIQKAHGGGFRDGFLAKFNASGSTLLFSTYLGGNGDDFFQTISRNSTDGLISMALHTDSTNFPAATAVNTGLGAVSQAAISNPASMVLAVRPGDVTETFYLIEWSLVEDDSDEPSPDETTAQQNLGRHIIFAVARMRPPQSPTHSAQAQAGGGLDFKLFAFDQNRNIIKTIFFGGSGEDTFNKIAGDLRGAVYVVGRTRSANLPVVNAIQALHSGGDAFDGFLTVFAPNTLNTLFATYLGGVGIESLNGVAVDPQGNIYVVGETFGNFPTTTPGALQSQLSGRTDAFVIKISPVTIPLPAAVDFDNDGKSDVGIYRDGTWVVIRSSDGGFAVDGLGGPTHIPVPADYDGDGKADIAVYLNGLWTIKRSSDGVINSVGFGGPAFTPVPADYDGDGKADVAVYSNGVWSILRSSDGGNTVVAHGGPGWFPVAADFDGDGKADIAVYINGAWSIIRSSDGGNTVVAHGGPPWIPLPADYDGDGKADAAVYFAGAWSIVRSSDGGNTVVGHGGPTWEPVPADYDGDGKTDISVHMSGAWSIIRSTNAGITVVGHGGGPTDIPLN